MNFVLHSGHIRAFCAALVLGAMTLVPASASYAEDEDEDYDEEYERPYTVEKKEDGWWVNQATFNGYRRYHSECHVCHGPNALGSSFAPNLAESLTFMNRDEVFEVMVNGRDSTNNRYGAGNVMPAFGDSPNVMPYAEDIYAYLKARSDGKLPPVRPKRKNEKTLD